MLVSVNHILACNKTDQQNAGAYNMIFTIFQTSKCFFYIDMQK